MAAAPVLGSRILVVIVHCDCDDRWWAQPEGGYFPVCQECGSEARPLGAPRRLESWTQERGERWRAERREHAIGGMLDVMMERDAVTESARRFGMQRVAGLLRRLAVTRGA